MLEAASERSGGIIEVHKELEKDCNDEGREGSIAALLRELMFHNATPADEDGIKDRFECTKFEVDSQSDIDTEIAKRIDEAVTNGLPKEMREVLENIWREHKSVFMLTLGNEGPADITPMRIQLDDNSTLVKVRVRRYPTEQRKFVNVYLNQLFK